MTPLLSYSLKKDSWEEFGQNSDTDYRWTNKVFWQTILGLRRKQTLVATFIEDANSVFLKHQTSILNCWKEYFCELLNPVTVQHLETSTEQIGEKIYLTKAQIRTAIKSLKAGKASGDENI